MFAKRGRIHSVTGKKAVVNIGSSDSPILTPLIDWCVPYAGTVNSQRVPSLNEQVVIVNTGDGTCLSECVIVGYLHSPAYPAPHGDADKLTIDTGGYQSDTDTEGNQTVKGAALKVTAISLVIDAKTTFKKAVDGVSAAWSEFCKAADINLHTHTHTEQGDGKDVSKPK